MAKFWLFLIFIGLLSVCLPWLVNATTLVDEICPGLQVVVQPEDSDDTYVSLRTEPQQKFIIFYGRGIWIANIPRGTKLTVEDVRTVDVLTKKQKWIKVTYKGLNGWVYVGKPNDDTNRWC